MALDREKTLQVAQKHVDRRKYDRALEEYRKVIGADPKDTRTLLKIGDVQTRSGDFTGAIRTYESVAAFYTKQGFSLKAIAVYKQILELAQTHLPQLVPNYKQIVERLAELYVGLGLINDALSTYDEEATRLRENDEESEAVAIYRRMAKVGQAVPISHLRLAEGLCRVGQVDEAMNSFWTAAELLIQGGRKPDALRVIERMLHFKPQPRAAKLAARLYLEQGGQPEAMQALSRLQLCFQANPKDIETLQLLARAFNLLGQEDKFLEVQKEIARQAHEQGRPSVFQQTIQELTAAAPDDDQVLALSQMPPPLSSNAPSEPIANRLATEAVPIPAPPLPPSNTATKTAAPNKPPTPPPRRPAAAAPPPPAESTNELDELDIELIESDAPTSLAKGQPVRAAAQELSVDETRALISNALINAQTRRDLGEYDSAITAIQNALTYDPRSIELREMLRDLYAENGNRNSAIDEMLTMVTIYTEYGRPDHARSVLLNILEAEPQHKVARQTLEQLEASLDAEEAPRYSLQPSYARGASSPPSDDAATADETSSPRTSSAAPLPRFEIEGETESAESEGASKGAETPAAESAVAADAGSLARPVSNPTGKRGVEDALEEADFYSSRAMFEDARLIIADQLKVNPNHPLLLENLEEIEDALKRHAAQSTSDNRDFDLGASLSELERVVRESQTPPAAGAAAQDVDVDAVFAKFKEGVRNQISDGDAATHYDLGVAYREMNLIDDAISELELAARDPARECTCHAMVGILHLKNERLAEARSSLGRALEANERTSAQEASVHYDLGHIAELQSRTAAAIYHFSEVEQRDARFRDTIERLKKLRAAASSPEASEQKPPTNDEEAVDRAFQELIGE